MMMIRRARNAATATALALLASACAYGINPVTGQREAFGYTWAQEVQLGKEADAQVVQEFGLYDDADLSAYVRRVGEKVLAQSHLRREGASAEFRSTSFTFRVLDSPVVNAFALPGGYVYVTRGLLAHLNNEAQLAVVLGHEIGHVVGRHSSKQAYKAQLGQLGLIGGAILAETIQRGTGQTVLDIGGTAAGLLFLKYGRDDERESDRLGVEYAAMSGYAAQEAAAFFESLKRITAHEGASIPEWQSTHPDPGEREQSIERMAAEWKQRGYQMTEVDGPAYFRTIDGIVIGDDPRQGFVDGGVFYHPGMAFRFPVPSGWKVANSPAAVQMVSPQQNAGLIFQGVEGASPAAAAQAFGGQEGLKVVSSDQAQINGNPAVIVVADATDQQGTQLRLVRAFIGFGGKVFAFTGISAAANFSSFSDTFMGTIRGFDRLTDQSKLAKKPARLDVVAVSRSGTLQSFLPSALPGDFDAEEVAILNQAALGKTVSRGESIKLPIAGR